MKKRASRSFREIFSDFGVVKKRRVSSLMRSEFDGDAYLLAYPDVAEAGIDPIAHYLEFGWREGRVAASWFDPKAYAKSVGNLDPCKENVFAHLLLSAQECDQDAQTLYLRITSGSEAFSFKRGKSGLLEGSGKGEVTEQEGPSRIGRLITKGAIADETIFIHLNPPSRDEKKLVESHFDAAYYCSTYPEIVHSGVDPLIHFMTIGWVEGRDPSPDFSTSYYLLQNEDIRKAGLNPYVHYLSTRTKEKWRNSASVDGARVLLPSSTC